MVLTGGCACSAVRYTAEVDTGVKAVCHCLNCQKVSARSYPQTIFQHVGLTNLQRTASAFSVNVIIPRDSFKITQGNTKSHTYLADSNKLYHTHFCGDCGSALYGEPEAFPDTVSIKAGSLDEAFTDLGTIDAEAFVIRRKNYLKPLEGVKQVDGMILP